MSLTERIRRLPDLTDDPLSLGGLSILFVWACINWSLTIRRIIWDYNPLPVWDYWQVAEHLNRYKALDWAVFWIQHNEHRIIFPEAVFAIDMLLFHGHQILSLVTSFGCYFGVWLVLAWVFNSDKTLSSDTRRMGILLAGIIIGWEGCTEVVGNTFLLQWTMLQIAVTLSLAFLAVSRRSLNPFYFVGALVSAIVATYSSGNGMLLWPVLLAAAFLLRMQKLRILILVITGSVSTWLFFVGYQSSNDLHILNLVEHPIYFIGFIASYLSMPAGALGKPPIGVIFGLVNLLFFLFLLLVCTRKHLLASAPAIVLFGSYVFAVATAVLTAAGRMNPADPLYQSAKAARYVSLPLVNWAVLILILVWVSARMKWELLSVSSVGVLCSLCLIGIFSELRPWLTGNGSFIADQQVATLSIENNLRDPDFERKLYSDPGFVPRMLPVLERNHVAIYSGVTALSWLGQSASAIFGYCDEQVKGRVSGVYPVKGGVEVVGNASLTSRASKVVFVGERGKIIGFGEQVEAGIPAVITTTPADHSNEWLGFINSEYGAKAFSTYLVGYHGHTLCLIEKRRALGEAAQITAAEAGTPIPGVNWSAKGWARNALPPPVTKSDPMTKEFWSSWNGADHSTGQLASSNIKVPANHCLVLSTIHGPSIDGLTVRLIDPGTSKVLERIPMRGGETGWKFWRIPLNPEATTIRVVAEDNGASWGQWLAITPPSDCR